MNAPRSLTNILGNEINNDADARDILISLATAPEMATNLLAHRQSHFLRPIKKHIVNAYANTMKAGGWRRRNIITIGYIRDQDVFFLIDGNNRLTALSGLADVQITFTFRITEFENPEDVAEFCSNCIDVNSPRTITDRQAILGAFVDIDVTPTYQKQAYAAIQFMVDGYKGKGGGSKAPAADDTLLAGFRDWHPHLSRYFNKVKDSKQLGSTLMLRGFLAMGAVIYRSQPELADNFYSDVIGRKDIISAYVDEVVMRGGFEARTPEGTARATVAAFNLMVNRGQIETLDEIIAELGEGEWQKAPIKLFGSVMNGEIERYHPTAVAEKTINADANWTVAPAELPRPQFVQQKGA